MHEVASKLLGCANFIVPITAIRRLTRDECNRVWAIRATFLVVIWQVSKDLIVIILEQYLQYGCNYLLLLFMVEQTWINYSWRYFVLYKFSWYSLWIFRFFLYCHSWYIFRNPKYLFVYVIFERTDWKSFQDIINYWLQTIV